MAVRAHFSVLLSVWRALFLREAVARLSQTPTAWLWIVVEPLAHVVFLMMLFGVVRHTTIYGVGGAPFIMTGVLPFIMFRNIAGRSRDAIDANKALFAYRQVKPVDAVVTRAFLECFLTVIAGLTLLAGAGLFGLDVVPQDPLRVVRAFASIALFGLGFGLFFSVAGDLLPNVGRFVKVMMTPLYFLSAVMYPSYGIHQPYRDLLLLNPLIHGVEDVRAGFFSSYRVPPELNLGYLSIVGLVLVFLGLALQVRYQARLVAR